MPPLSFFITSHCFSSLVRHEGDAIKYMFIDDVDTNDYEYQQQLILSRDDEGYLFPDSLEINGLTTDLYS